MPRRLLYLTAIVLLAISVLFVVWQGSFHLKRFSPADPQQTLILWAMSTLIFVLMVTPRLGPLADRHQALRRASRQPRRLADQDQAGGRRAGAQRRARLFSWWPFSYKFSIST